MNPEELPSFNLLRMGGYSIPHRFEKHGMLFYSSETSRVYHVVGYLNRLRGGTVICGTEKMDFLAHLNIRSLCNRQGNFVLADDADIWLKDEPLSNKRLCVPCAKKAFALEIFSQDKRCKEVRHTWDLRCSRCQTFVGSRQQLLHNSLVLCPSESAGPSELICKDCLIVPVKNWTSETEEALFGV